MTTTVQKHEEKAAKKEAAARERYKSRREDRKPGAEEIETMRTDQIFTKRSDSAMAVRTCAVVVDPRLPESALFSQVRLETNASSASHPLPLSLECYIFDGPANSEEPLDEGTMFLETCNSGLLLWS